MLENSMQEHEVSNDVWARYFESKKRRNGKKTSSRKWSTFKVLMGSNYSRANVELRMEKLFLDVP